MIFFLHLRSIKNDSPPGTSLVKPISNEIFDRALKKIEKPELKQLNQPRVKQNQICEETCDFLTKIYQNNLIDLNYITKGNFGKFTRTKIKQCVLRRTQTR
jgi:fructose-1,6-bisphosphatase